jgi:tRNA(Glu) U13 pseudouridine synthase TruD
MQNENEDLLTPNYLTEADPTPVIIRPTIEQPNVSKICKAIRLRFSLTTSSYATMLLREITRTSSAFYA